MSSDKYASNDEYGSKMQMPILMKNKLSSGGAI